ncbi:hypothetical protein EDC04DRAFT_2607212 [Pisolithus marmoratus]|nr:hypothetical protein EDC04DRAFT_2607212 [Pisolithus marmoratus]
MSARRPTTECQPMHPPGLVQLSRFTAAKPEGTGYALEVLSILLHLKFLERRKSAVAKRTGTASQFSPQYLWATSGRHSPTSLALGDVTEEEVALVQPMKADEPSMSAKGSRGEGKRITFQGAVRLPVNSTYYDCRRNEVSGGRTVSNQTGSPHGIQSSDLVNGPSWSRLAHTSAKSSIIFGNNFPNMSSESASATCGRSGLSGGLCGNATAPRFGSAHTLLILSNPMDIDFDPSCSTDSDARGDSGFVPVAITGNLEGATNPPTCEEDEGSEAVRYEGKG